MQEFQNTRTKHLSESLDQGCPSLAETFKRELKVTVVGCKEAWNSSLKGRSDSCQPLPSSTEISAFRVTTSVWRFLHYWGIGCQRSGLLVVNKPVSVLSRKTLG